MRALRVGFGFVLAPLLSAGAALGADGVIEINQAKALAGGVTSADAPGFPVTLVAGASYVLTSDLVVTNDSTDVIDDAPPPAGASQGSIHLDLNGFSVRCQNPTPICGGGFGGGTGIRITDVSDVTITNGSVLGLRGSGIEVLTSGARIDRIHAVGNGITGILCESGCMVTNSMARSNSTGITVRARSTVLSCVSRNNVGNGVIVGPESNVRDSTVTGNGGFGVLLENLTPAPWGYGGNVFVGNGQTVSASGIQTGGNVCGTDAICP